MRIAVLSGHLSRRGMLLAQRTSEGKFSGVNYIEVTKLPSGCVVIERFVDSAD